MSRNAVVILVFLIIFSQVVGCATPPTRVARQYELQNEFLKAVIEYRRAYNADPENLETKSLLLQAESKAADFYYLRGAKEADAGRYDDAVVSYQQGLAAKPDDERIQKGLEHAVSKREAVVLVEQARKFFDVQNNDEGTKLLDKAGRLDPANEAVVALTKKRKGNVVARNRQKFSLSSSSPVTLNFRQADVKTVLEFVGKSFGVNVILEESVKATAPVTLFAKDVTFEQGLALVLAASKTSYVQINSNTVLITPDTKEKRAQYGDYSIRTFSLGSARAKDVGDLVRGLVAPSRLYVNEVLNTLTVRDSDEVIRQVEKLVEINDRKPPEIVLEVEILEMNRTKAERLGLDFGSYQFGASLPSPGTVPLFGSLKESIKGAAVLSLPSVTLRYFKQDVDARTLANPRVRVVSGKTAKIHIGDRVPLRASTVLNPTGQVNTTYDYKEIGIKLDVTPFVNFDNSATVKLALEISSLGANLGTTSEPAYRIGTRNAESEMVLQNGETAILGGLIRDEDRKSVTTVPFFGEIPAVGTLFGSHENGKERTDILLTITPRVVRAWDVPDPTTRSFYSGTEDKLLEERPFRTLMNESGTASDVPDSAQATNALRTEDSQTVGKQSGTLVGQAPVGAVQSKATVGFDKPVYQVAVGEDFDVILKVTSADSESDSLTMDLLYDQRLLQFVGQGNALPVGSTFKFEPRGSGGVIHMEGRLRGENGEERPSSILTLRFRSATSGFAELSFRDLSVRLKTGELGGAQGGVARVLMH